MDELTSEKPTPVSIFEILATLPSGRPGQELTPAEFGDYLRKHVGTDSERDRMRRHALRDELYRDGGMSAMETMITNLFADPDVQKLRKAAVPYARFNNVIKRIVNEMSTVYSEPAHRSVGETKEAVDEIDRKIDDIQAGKPARIETPNNDRYQAALDAVCMDERMVEVGRLLNLHRALLVGFRVRKLPDSTREPTIDIVTPSNVRVITHPNDDTLVVGWLIKCSHRTARTSEEIPHWTLWTSFECVQLRENFEPIPSTYLEHGLGVCPWVPVTLGPTGPGFWPGSEGEDLVSGQLTIWFEHVLMIKESKSATKQSIITGDGTNMARGMAADTERVGELADGQSMTTVDMSMDLNLFKGVSDHVVDSLSLNYGVPPAVTRGQHAESAEARELQMLPLKAIRRRQQIPLRRFEYRFALVMSAVLKIDMPELAFEVLHWLIEFAETETPLDPQADHALFLEERAAGMTNSVDRMKKKYPGLEDDGAWARIERNYEVEERRNKLMRPLIAISGSMGAAMPDGNKPSFEQNRGESRPPEDAEEKPEDS